MYLLDIASAPLYTVFGGSFLLIAAVVFAVVWVAIRLILGIIGKNSVSERYFIRTDHDVSVLLPEAEKVSDFAYITDPLNYSEISVLEEKINEHGKLLSKIPVFE